jgi:hypothetical protein
LDETELLELFTELEEFDDLDDAIELDTEETTLDFELAMLLELLLEDMELFEAGVELEDATALQAPRLFQAFACAQPTPGS